MIPLRVTLDVDNETPVNVSQLEKFAIANQGTGTVSVQVSFDQEATAWVELQEIGPGDICTNPALTPSDTRNAFRPVWVRAVETDAGTHRVILGGSQ